MAVKNVLRRGVVHLVIDIGYRKRDGSPGRYRRDALVQTRAAAGAEDRRRTASLLIVGTPDDTAVVDDLRRNVPLPSTAPLLRDVTPDYFATWAPANLRWSTERSYRNCFDSTILPIAGHLPLDRIGAVENDAILRAVLGRGSSKATGRNHLVVFRSLLCKYAVERNLLPCAPRLQRLPKMSRAVIRKLTDPLVDRILAATREPWRLALLICRWTGLRASEVRALRWRNFDLDDRLLIVEASICRGREGTPKSGHQRGLPLAAPLVEALLAVRSRPRDGFVVGRSPLKPAGEKAYWSEFKRAASQCSIEGFTLKDFRAYFITGLFRRGAGATTVMALAGHEHLSTTQRYAGVFDEDKRAAIDRLEKPV